MVSRQTYCSRRRAMAWSFVLAWSRTFSGAGPPGVDMSWPARRVAASKKKSTRIRVGVGFTPNLFLRRIDHAGLPILRHAVLLHHVGRFQLGAFGSARLFHRFIAVEEGESEPEVGPLIVLRDEI